MKLQLAVLILSLIASGSALALDKTDEGVFALVHEDGQITKKIARLSQAEGSWHLEDRKPDDSWEDVTCGDACALVETSPEQVAQFLRGTALDGHVMECVHNQAFAFCRSGTAADSRMYHMLAFADGMVIPLKWVRLDPDTLDPAVAP